MESAKTATSGMTTDDVQIDPEIEVRRRIRLDFVLLAQAGRLAHEDWQLLDWLITSGASGARLRSALFATLYHPSRAVH